MKKFILISVAVLMLWASPVVAQQSRPRARNGPGRRAGGADRRRMLRHSKADRATPLPASTNISNPRPQASLDLEWDPLPHRFVLESTFLNPKDYFGELDYAYRDIGRVQRVHPRDVFHNLNHYTFGLDDPLPRDRRALPTCNPDDLYGIENQLRRAFAPVQDPRFPASICMPMCGPSTGKARSSSGSFATGRLQQGLPVPDHRLEHRGVPRRREQPSGAGRSRLQPYGKEVRRQSGKRC